MATAAEKLGVELDIAQEPVFDAAEAAKVAADCKRSRPDGILATVLQLDRFGRPVNTFWRSAAKPPQSSSAPWARPSSRTWNSRGR